jgi:hypothetical protein
MPGVWMASFLQFSIHDSDFLTIVLTTDLIIYFFGALATLAALRMLRIENAEKKT